jgi:hypothetical protein
MPVIIGEKKPSPAPATPYYKRMIRCPGHWLVHPSVDVYKREQVGMLKNCSDFVEYQGKRIKIKKTRIARDKWGRKILDWRKLYELKKTGKVLQPRLTAAEAIEKVYDPKSALCINCPKYCKEGQGRILTHTIRRLNG